MWVPYQRNIFDACNTWITWNIHTTCIFITYFICWRLLMNSLLRKLLWNALRMSQIWRRWWRDLILIIVLPFSTNFKIIQLCYLICIVTLIIVKSIPLAEQKSINIKNISVNFGIYKDVWQGIYHAWSVFWSFLVKIVMWRSISWLEVSVRPNE